MSLAIAGCRLMSKLARPELQRCLALLIGALALVLPACETDGQFTILGYSTMPNYDPNIRTVYVPIFQNRTFARGLEFEVTKAVIRAIESKTPFKVVHDCECADTELLGTIIAYNKAILNRNQLNELREAQFVLGVEMFWRNIRTGEILSKPRSGVMGPPPGLAFAEDATPGTQMSVPLSTPAAPDSLETPAPTPRHGNSIGPDGETLPAPTKEHGGHGHGGGVFHDHDPAAPKPVLVTSEGNFIPEVGETTTTAVQRNVNRLAIQVVNMMEKPW